MSRLKIATFADLHVGVTTYGVIDPSTGLNTRVITALQSLDTMIDYCIDNKIKYIVGAGDIYKNSLPTPTLQREFNIRIKRAANNGIQVYLQSGNHDVSSVEHAKSPLDPFNTLKVDNIYHSRFKKVFNVDDLFNILILPAYCKQEDIEKILDEYNENKPTLIIGHLTVLGAKLNDWLVEQNELAVNSKVFIRPNIFAVALGHLHKHQILNDQPLTYYTGSLQRIDFTEEHQKKGFVVLDVDLDKNDTKYKFIEIPSQKFFTINLDLKDSDDEMKVVTNFITMNDENIKNAIVRVLLDVKKSNNINEEIIKKMLIDLGCKTIATIQKNVDRDEMIRNKSIDETITAEQALRLYFKDHENSEELINEGLKLLKLMENNI